LYTSNNRRPVKVTRSKLPHICNQLNSWNRLRIPTGGESNAAGWIKNLKQID
jgi:hypothetical protein